MELNHIANLRQIVTSCGKLIVILAMMRMLVFYNVAAPVEHAHVNSLVIGFMTRTRAGLHICQQNSSGITQMHGTTN